MNTSNSTSSTTDPKGFMTEAAKGGMAEVELGKVAVSKAQNAEVKQFAQQMVAEHTKANNELKQLAEKKSVTLPTDLDAMHKSMKDKLSNLSGAEFDKEYIKGQVEDHEKTVALFEAQSTGGTDADAKAMAMKTLPNLKAHLDMARKIQAKLK
jgi:putative membrane protein